MAVVLFVVYQFCMQCVQALRLTDPLALGRLDLFAQAMVGGGEDDPDVKALTIALVNGRIVDATIRCLFYGCRQPFRVLLICAAQCAAVDRYTTRAVFPFRFFFMFSNPSGMGVTAAGMLPIHRHGLRPAVVGRTT